MFIQEAKKLNLERIENISEFSLTFLRPAPPKMSMRPTQIRGHLFPNYKSVPPPVDDENLLKKAPRSSPRRIKLGSIKSKSLIRSAPNSAKFNQIEELDESDDLKSKKSSLINIEEDEDDFEDSEMEFQCILEKLLNRQHKSETDLSKLKWDENDSGDLATLNQDPLFTKETTLFRTLSDSVLTRRKTSKRINEYADEASQEKEFLKIDTDYNDAMDEVFYQKQKIREEHWIKNPLASVSMASVGQERVKSVMNENANTSKTPDEEDDDEIKAIETKSLKQSLQASNESKSNSKTATESNFFPKGYTNFFSIKCMAWSFSIFRRVMRVKIDHKK